MSTSLHGSGRRARLSQTVVVLAAIALAAGCTAGGSKADRTIAPDSSAKCELPGAAAGTLTLCLKTAGASAVPSGTIKELYRPTADSSDVQLQLAINTLADDGSMFAYSVTEDSGDSTTDGSDLGDGTTDGSEDDGAVLDDDATIDNSGTSGDGAVIENSSRTSTTTASDPAPSDGATDDGATTDDGTLSDDGTVTDDGTLSDDGTITDDGTDQATAATGHPVVGMMTKDGFTPFERDLTADAAYSIVGQVRSGGTSAWLEEASSPDADLPDPWAAFSYRDGTLTQVATLGTVDEAESLPLDTTDPGPRIDGDQLLWRVADDTVDETNGDEAADTTQSAAVLLSAPLAGGKVTATENDPGLANRDASGDHYELANAASKTSYEIQRRDAAGKTTSVYRGTIDDNVVVDGPIVTDGTVVWVEQNAPADEQTGDSGQDNGDGATPSAAASASATGAATPSPSPTASRTRGSAAIFAYSPSAKQLTRIETTDATVSAQYIAVGAQRLGWGGDEDPAEYVVDLAGASIYTVGSCEYCNLVGLSPGGAIYWNEPSSSDPTVPVSVVGTFFDARK